MCIPLTNCYPGFHEREWTENSPKVTVTRPAVAAEPQTLQECFAWGTREIPCVRVSNTLERVVTQVQ